MASQITGVSIVYSTLCSCADQRKHQSSASLVFVWGIHRWPVNSPHKGPVPRKIFPFDDVIMKRQNVCCVTVAIHVAMSQLGGYWWAGAYLLPEYLQDYIQSCNQRHVFDDSLWVLWRPYLQRSFCVCAQPCNERRRYIFHWLGAYTKWSLYLCSNHSACLLLLRANHYRYYFRRRIMWSFLRSDYYGYCFCHHII